ncbi:MAG TPA: LamG-like jellyroll fold domain-containing protein, partial [Candidatus Limnocylindrales bacterium]|nr:LamG-like jellyroll fold domain-containing protein [Candidatus Limnocylindrales bacterium]
MLLFETLGPLAPSVLAEDPVAPDAMAEGQRAFPNGRVIQTAPAPITTPTGGVGPGADPTIGGEPLFLPYTPPDDVTELATERSQQSRTLAHPDGSFTTEISEGPINYQDKSGSWKPIDLSLVETSDGSGFTVAATGPDIAIGAHDGFLGSISVGGHTVSVSAPIYTDGTKGEGDDVNRVLFAPLVSGGPSVWVRPIDIGLEFGATWADASEIPSFGLHLETGDLTPVLADDGRTVRFLDAKGAFAGRISLPILREGSGDSPPILDHVSVGLFQDPTTGYVLTYTVDAKWFVQPERIFPLILDPTWCIGAGAWNEPCDDVYSPNSFDTFVFDADPSSHEVGWTVLRTGYDSRSDDGDSYGKMRSILYFPQVALPDGAVISDTDLQATVCCLYGSPQGETITAYRLTKQLTVYYNWNKFGNAYDGAVGGVTDTVPASGTMNWDVDDIVTSFYTRRSAGWKPPFGFLLKMNAEGSSHGEVEFRRYNSTVATRPLLTITYTLPKVGIDFDPRLGPTYAPSTMVAGQATKLPIIVENKAGSAHTLAYCNGIVSDCWKVGFRWFDGKGNRVTIPGGDAASTRDLPATISVGSSSSVVPLTVTPPTATGQYTLTLDAVHYKDGRYAWASDFATPSLYHSRNKKILTSSSTRWTGSSKIERDEFSINVTEGVGGSNVESVGVASGGELGIDLATRNLSYSADSGLGFSDRLPVGLSYGYNEAVAELCSGYQGLLGACGWFTNWDERIVGGSNQTGFDYSYVDPSGTPYMLDTDGSGQIAGGAPVLINRQRVTILEENGGWDGSDADSLPDIAAIPGGGISPSAFAGSYIARAVSDTTTYTNAPDKVSLNTYRRARFAIRTQYAAKAGLCFQIHNVANSAAYPDRWWCYTLGSATWSAGDDSRFLTGTSGLTTAWFYRDENLYDDVRSDGDYGTILDDYQVVKIRIQSAGAGPGWTYVDGFRFEPTETVKVNDSNISWTTGSGQTSTSSDAVVGTSAIQIVPGTGVNPVCGVGNGCWGALEGGMWGYPFANWYWKKVGGSTAAMVFYLHDERSGAHCNTADCTLTYYAGAAPNFVGGGQYDAVIRISERMPVSWTNVRRNVLEDARQALNLYDDATTGSGDDVKIKGFAPVAVDGAYLLLDRWAYGNLADVGTVDQTGQAGPQSHPSSVGDSAFTYDYMADYSDGSRHYFNRDGLLVRIRNRDRQEILLDRSYDTTKAGPTAYTVTAIHAPTDGTSSGGTTFNRQLTITRGLDGSNPTIRFDEDLGTTGSDSSGRAVIFVVGTGATPDLLKVSPARTIPADGDATGTFCPARTPGGNGNGCVEFIFAASHRLQYLADPRWDGTTGTGAEYRLEIGRSGNDPVSIKDKSHGNAALLNVLTFSDASGVLYNRPIWQDAAAVAAGAAIAADLNPDGQTVTRYVPKSCAGSCSPPPTWTSSYKAVDYEFDGLARVTTVKAYRCPVATTAISGCTGGEDVTMTRQETSSGAKVDNYADPLAGGRLAWRADADQVFASLRDSGGANADWYRTEYVYDGDGQIAESIEVREVAGANYPDTVELNDPKGYWRLEETGGATMADSSGYAKNGSYFASPSLDQGPALIRAASTNSVKFNGSSQYGSVTGASLGTISGTFSSEAWIRTSTDTVTAQAFVGSRGPSDFGFAAKLCRQTCAGGEGIRIDVGTGSAWLLNGTVPFAWQKERWYYVAVVVDGPSRRALVYVDGSLTGSLTFATAGTPLLTNATHDLHVARTGLTTSPEWFNGYVDEVAVYSTALSTSDVAAHFRAGRAVATVDTTVRRDNQGRPLETATSFLVDPGFEQHGNGWALGSGATISTSEFNPGGARSLQASATATTQVAQLLPGQTFRLQFATKSSAGTTPVHAKLEYWQLDGSPAFSTLAGSIDTDYTNTSWGGHAYDVTLPFDTDGRVRVSFTETGTGSGWVDDVLLVTGWGLVAYDTTLGSIGYGLPTDRWGLATCTVGPCSIATVRTQLQYAANTSSPTYHPAIFPTKTIANYQDGTQGSGAAEDVTTQSAYDSWGRVLVATDPDGVATTTVYAANLTDVFQARDGLSQVTEMTYDRVGNALTTKTPLGRITSSTFDGRNQQLTTTAPDGTRSQTDYDSYGRPSASWANYVNGAVETTDGDSTDDVLVVPTYDIFGNTITTKAECGEPACSSGLRATSGAAFDLLGTTVASTTYPNANGTGTARTTTRHFETTTPPSGAPFAGLRFSRTQPTGSQLAIAPSAAPALLCPGSASQYCNSVTSVDLTGRALVTTDAYGVKTVVAYDVAGKAVRTISGYGDGAPGPAADEDVATTVIHDLAGNPVVTWDPLNRRDERTYDLLGRLLEVKHLDSTGAEFLRESTEYKPSGRIDATFDGSAWTRTLYDGAGRAVRTVANIDHSAGAASMTLDGLEGGTGAWQPGPAIFFTTSAAAGITTDEDAAGNAYHAVAPVSGHGRLRITTHATNTNDGAWLDITAGATYQSGHVYKASFDLAASAAGLSLTAYLGQDSSGGSYGSLGITSTTAWTRYTVSWTAGSSLNSNIRFALRKAAAGTSELYLDNLVVWDSSAPQTGIVSSVSAYNADGEITASVLPPGDPATERPLVTTVAYDAVGRTMASVVNGASGGYASTVKTTSGIVAYLPLDERIGSAADMQGGGSPSATGAAFLGVAGGIDEARTAARFAGGRLTRATSATSATTNVSLEAWLRSDAANPAATVVVAANGTEANGWGLGMDASGNAAGVAISSSTLTTMSSTARVNDGRWHHVVLTRGASTWAMSVDGVAKTLSNNTTSPGTPGAGLSVGALADGSRPFTGEVDEVA